MMKNNVKLQTLHFFVLAGIVVMYLYRCSQKKAGTTPSAKEHFSEGKIEFYGRISCPFTVQMKKMLETDSRFQDIEIDETVKKEIPAVPYFLNPKNGKEVVGAQESADKLYNQLQ